MSLKLNAIVPIILKTLQRSAMKTTQPEKAPAQLSDIENAVGDENQSIKSFQSRQESALSSCRDEPDTTLAKIALIQAHLLVGSICCLTIDFLTTYFYTLLVVAT